MHGPRNAKVETVQYLEVDIHGDKQRYKVRHDIKMWRIIC